MKKPLKRLFRRPDPMFPTGIGIGAADEGVIDRIEQAVRQLRPDLDILSFTTRKHYMDVFADRPRIYHKQGCIGVVFVCTDPPARIRLAGDTGPDFRRIAIDLARKVNTIAICRDIGARSELRDSRCVEVMGLEQLIAQIPDKLEDWLKPRH